MAGDEHCLWRAALDLGMSASDSLVLVTTPPTRWDELLDTRLPVLIAESVCEWEALGADLWEAGCPAGLPLRLVEANGRVTSLAWEGERLRPSPAAPGWTLSLGWSHEREGWRSRLPLFGQRFAVTRAAEQAAPLVERLKTLGAEAFAAPTIAFTDPDDFGPWVQAVGRMAEWDWILLTSPKGVDSFIERLCGSGLDLRVLGAARFACIGPSTAKALARHSLKADLVPEEYVAEGLLAALFSELGPDLSGHRFLLPRAQVARTVLPEALAAAGGDVLVAPVYKTVAPELGEVSEGEATLLFTSSSTVTNWVEASTNTPAAEWPCYCIGPITAATATEHGLKVLGVAETYTVDGLVEMLVRAG